MQCHKVLADLVGIMQFAEVLVAPTCGSNTSPLCMISAFKSSTRESFILLMIYTHNWM